MTASQFAAPSSAEQDIFYRASRFLGWEAKLLDERRFDEWLELIHDDVVYEVPLRLAKQKYSDETPPGAYRIYDTKKLLKVRVDRLNCGSCWSETPPSLTVRVVGGVIVEPTDDQNTWSVESALLMYRQRGGDAPGDVIPVRRQDMIVFGSAETKLLRRRALIAETVLHTPNLGVFL